MKDKHGFIEHDVVSEACVNQLLSAKLEALIGDLLSHRVEHISFNWRIKLHQIKTIFKV